MVWVAVLLGVALVAWLSRRELYRDLPGPTRLPLLGSAFAFLGTTHEQLWELPAGMFARYGGRFAVKVCHQYVLHVRERRDVAAVLSHSRNITKNIAYDFVRPLLGDGLLTNTGKTWFTHRRILTPAFHSSALEQYLRAFRIAGAELADELLLQQQSQPEGVDLLPIVSKHMLHTLCSTVMGLDGGCSLKGVEEYEEAVRDIGAAAATRLANAWMHSDLVFHLLPAGRRFRRAVEVARRFADRLVERKSVAGKGRGVEERAGEDRTVLDLLLAARRRGELDTQAVRDEVNTFLFAGHETTAAAVTFGLMLLAEREDIQEQLYSEYATAVGAEPPSAATLAALPLLDAVVREVLRLYPSAPVISRLVDEDFDMNGVVVRRGTHVAVHLYQLQRQARQFPAPDTFRPERFLRPAPPPPPFAVAPFSAGPRNCIGQKFARLELKVVLGEVVRRLRMSPLPAARPALRADLVLRPAHPVRVRLRPRPPVTAPRITRATSVLDQE
ncbi:cytochrome P450 4d2-like [Aricia agestis]|uniref:cytochrome P450 4d2-like n=1 Tax=Aricia agestis TaxID=91739 RepID=UPI001C204260|nr:cytochrome P450 4d2-like [Aricia agestis]